jgi:hypothetical protein
MTVAELIEILKLLPPDNRVVTYGYEGGYDDIQKIEQMQIILNFHPESYYGRHESVHESDLEEPKETIDAVLLQPERR